MNSDRNLYVLLENKVVRRTHRGVTNTISLYTLTNVLLVFICFKLVMKLMKFY